MFEGTVFGRLDQSLQKAIKDVGYERPTPIQEQTVGPALDGRDIVGSAQTGTGKTAAFMLPILNRLVKVRRPRQIGHPRALVLSPTRELAAQTAANVRDYSKYCNLPFACVFGGVPQGGQVKDIKKGAETVVACPGRLIDLMCQGILFLDRVECFVLDEADRMMDMGFMPDIKRIISKLPVKRQSMFFSATLSEKMRAVAREMTHDPVEVSVEPETVTVEKIEQSAMIVDKSRKDALLKWLLEKHPEWTKVIVFTKMRHGADRVSRKLLKSGIASATIHSDKTQNQRTRALEAFKRGDVRVLVATDIASRGIDVSDVSCVVNMELPLETESYVHRIGRTARRGECGVAVSFTSPEERGQLKSVERFIRKTIRIDDSHPYVPAAGFPPDRPPEGTPAQDADGRRSGGRKRRGRKNGRKSFLGRRQPDFGQKGKGIQP